MGTYVNPANAITASRYLLLPPYLYWIDSGQIHYAFLAIVASAALDLFDGPAARYFNCSSGFGEFFDAITDAICYSFYLLVLVLYGAVPWVPMVLFVVLGAFNGYLRAQYARRIGRATNYRSWAMERVVGFFAAIGGLGLAGIQVDYFAWTMTGVMAIVVAHDTKRMLFDPVPADASDSASEASADAEAVPV